MANPARGEVGFDAGGESYTLKYGVNALAEIERAFGVKMRELAPVLADPTIDQVLVLIRCGLRPRRDAEAVGDLIDEIGGLEKAGDLLKEAFELAFAQGEARAGTTAPETTAS